MSSFEPKNEQKYVCTSALASKVGQIIKIMAHSDYLSSNIIICIFFDLIYFREVGQKYRNIFVRFLVQMKISKRYSETNWPLVHWPDTQKKSIMDQT